MPILPPKPSSLNKDGIRPSSKKSHKSRRSTSITTTESKSLLSGKSHPSPTADELVPYHPRRGSSITSDRSKSILSGKSHLSPTGQELALYPPPIDHVILPKARHNGWNVPLGVHRVVCASPGLRVSAQVHRRSAPVVVARRVVSGLTGNRRVRSEVVEEELIVPPGSYVNVLETQIHGDRVRGRICWEEEGDDGRDNVTKGGGITRRTSRLIKRTAVTVSRGMKERKGKRIAKRSYEGWLSLQWAREDRGNQEGGTFDDDLVEKKNDAARSGATDEDSGPWVSSYLSR